MQHPKLLTNYAPAHHVLDLAPTLQVDVQTIVGQQIAVFGLPGSGKTNFGALFLEQLSQYCVPMVVFDKEGDYASLASYMPRGVHATREQCPSGFDVLNDGLQVVYDLASWGSDEAAASLIVSVIEDLMQWANAQPPQERVPCLIVIDEAAHWLPERRGSYLKKDTFKMLFDSLRDVGSTGRKRGLTPVYLTPKMSQLAKAVLYPGVYVFMKTTLDADLKCYLEYIRSGDLTARQMKARIATFAKGKAIICLPDGSQKIVTFHERQSEHTSHTPGVQAALNKYASMPTPATRYGVHLVKSTSRVVMPDEQIDEKIVYHIGRMVELWPDGLTLNQLATSYLKGTDKNRVEQRVFALVESGQLLAHPTTHSTRYQVSV